LPRAQAERIASLRALVTVDPMQARTTLSLSLRSPAAGLRDGRRERRRGLVREARSLLRYVLGQVAPASLSRRYVRALEELGHRDPLPLPAVVHAHPSWLAALDSTPWLAAAGATELGWRIRAAFALAEASPLGARRMARRSPSMPQELAAVVPALAAEAFWRAVRIVAGPWLKHMLRADVRP